MTDPALAALVQKLVMDQQSILWLVDEQLEEYDLKAIAKNAALRCMTNRYDCYTALQSAGCDTVFKDFDFSAWEDASFQTVYYRVSKEKAVVHHIINQSHRVLQPGGQLILAGLKNEGIKTYSKKAQSLYGGALQSTRLKPLAFLNTIERPQTAREIDAPWLDDRDYHQLREIGNQLSPPLLSKPGIFGWEKIDEGSAFLFETLARELSEAGDKTSRLLDLGCGYGYLSIMAAQLGYLQIDATDNNCAALLACNENFNRHSIRGEIIADDCAATIEKTYPIILCNPPFHQGFKVQGDLTDKFLAAAKRLLGPGGQAYFVVNAFVPLERKAQGYFKQLSTRANNGRFKVICLQH